MARKTLSAISISSVALILLGHESISAFDEGSAGSEIADMLYESSYLSLLTQHRWNFATKKVSLALLKSDGKEYIYAIPSDCIYVIGSEEGIDYRIVGNNIHTINGGVFTLMYIHKVKESLLPPFFVKTLQYNLAMQFAVPLTGDLALGDLYRGYFNLELRKAKFADSSQSRQIPMRGINRYSNARNY